MMDVMTIAVCGLHMRGLGLNYQMTDLGAVYKETCVTSPEYSLKLLRGNPDKPFLSSGSVGNSIEVELWDMPIDAVGRFLKQIPSPLALGRIMLCDGREVVGFIGQAGYEQRLEDISVFGSWRTYMKMER